MISAEEARRLFEEKDESEEWINEIDEGIREAAKRGCKRFLIDYRAETNELTRKKIKEILINNGYEVEIISPRHFEYGGLNIKWGKED